MQLTWLGHASWLITLGNGTIIALDPYAGDISNVQADIICISHSHLDHSDSGKIGQLRKGTTNIITSQENALKVQGGIGLAVGGSQKIGSVTIRAVPAYNTNKFRAPNTPYHPKDFGVGFVLEAEGKKIYHTGDSDHIPEMAELNDLDIAMVPIGGTYTMTLDEAVAAVKTMAPKVVIPMHYNTPAIEVAANPNEFKQKVEAATKTKVFIFSPGETQEI
ncbi:MAG: MBL fold metallo-hydrolase [Patescibacteria group bacterium]